MAKRPRRERGSLNPDDILDGAFELADEVSIDNLSMPMLGKHLDVGVTSIYWYFRKKDDLLSAMADRALREYTYSMPFVEAANWRDTLRNHARTVRETFVNNPILCDLILIRSSLSPQAAQLGAKQTESVVANLIESGFTLEDSVDVYSAVQLHVHGMIVLHRLQEKNRQSEAPSGAYYELFPISSETTPLLAEANTKGLQSGGAHRPELRIRTRVHPRPRRTPARSRTLLRHEPESEVPQRDSCHELARPLLNGRRATVPRAAETPCRTCGHRGYRRCASPTVPPACTRYRGPGRPDAPEPCRTRPCVHRGRRRPNRRRGRRRAPDRRRRDIARGLRVERAPQRRVRLLDACRPDLASKSRPL